MSTSGPIPYDDGRRIPSARVLGIVAAVLTAAVVAVSLALLPSEAPPPTGPDVAGDGAAASSTEPASAPAPTAEPAPAATRSPEPPSVLVVAGDPDALNGSEQVLLEHLDERGFAVLVADDDEIGDLVADEHELIIVSKTVESSTVGDAVTATSASVMTWEDNAQAIEQGGRLEEQGTGIPLLSLIDVVNAEDTAWHGPGEEWVVDPDAPAELRAELSGRTPVYASAEEMTYAPAGTLPDDATVVAGFGEDPDRVTYYVYDEGDQLADGSSAAGRRIYFGLYDDTFSQLSDAGLDLFDAAVDWGLGR